MYSIEKGAYAAANGALERLTEVGGCWKSPCDSRIMAYHFLMFLVATTSNMR